MGERDDLDVAPESSNPPQASADASPDPAPPEGASPSAAPASAGSASAESPPEAGALDGAASPSEGAAAASAGDDASAGQPSAEPFPGAPSSAGPSSTASESAEGAPQSAAPESAAPESAVPTAEAAPQPPAPQPPAQLSAAERARRRDKVLGLGIVVLAFGVSMLISVWAKHRSLPPESEPPAPPSTAGIPGFPDKVNPTALVSQARALTARPLFRGFVAEGVNVHGLVDVSEKGGRVRYSFQSEPGRGAQPRREPGTLPTRMWCGRQSIVLKQDGLGAEPDVAAFPCTSKPPKQTLPEPTCDLAALWQLAKKKGAPTQRKARIEYYEAQKGPAYRFSIPGTKHRFVVGADCKRELKGKQALGHVP